MLDFYLENLFLIVYGNSWSKILMNTCLAANKNYDKQPITGTETFDIEQT
jgi:hypothetical protein